MARTPRTRGGQPKAEPTNAEGAENAATSAASASAPSEFAASESLTPEAADQAPVSTVEDEPAGAPDTEALAEPPAAPGETAFPVATLTEFSASDAPTPSENAALAEPPAGDYPIDDLPLGDQAAKPPADTAALTDASAEFAASESLLPEPSGEASGSDSESNLDSDMNAEALAEPPASPSETAPLAATPTEFSASDSLTPGESAALAEPPAGDHPADDLPRTDEAAEAPPESIETAGASLLDEAAASPATSEDRWSGETASEGEASQAVPMAELEGPGIAAAPVTPDPDEPTLAWQGASTSPASDDAQTVEAEREPVDDPLQDVPLAEMEGPGIAAAPLADEATSQSGEEAAVAPTHADDARSADWERSPFADSLNDTSTEGGNPSAATDKATFHDEPTNARGADGATTADFATPAAAAIAASSVGAGGGRRSDYGSATPSAPPAKRGSGGLFAAGLLGGVSALVLAGLLQFAGILPSVGSSGAATGGTTQAFQSEIDGLKAQVAELRQAGTGAATAADPALGSRIDTLQAEVDQLKSAAPAAAGVPPELETRLAAAEEKLAGVSNGVSAEQLATVASQAAAAQTAAQSNDGAVKDAAARVATLEQNFSGVQSGVSELQTEVAALQKGMETLQAQPRVALALAGSALKEAAERGAPFTAELATLSTLAPDAPEIPQLQSYAESGVPTREALLADWNGSVDAVLATESPVDENAGIMSKLLSGAGSLVSVRPIGAVDGPGTSAIVGRVQAAMEGGDLKTAMAEFDTLPDAAKAAAAAFAEKARARLAVEDLVNGAIASAAKAA